jgi:hypothetical protein
MVEKKPTNIHQKLAEITKLVDVLQKDASGYNYRYVSQEQILSRVTLGLEQQRLEVHPHIVPGTINVIDHTYEKKKTDKAGNAKEETVSEVIVSAEIIFTWVNLDDPTETLSIPWIIIGQQSDASQALGSALSYCERYFYLKFFHIATTEDDPDNFRSKQAEIEDGQAKAVIGAVVDEITNLINEYIGEPKDKEKAGSIKAFLMDNNGNNADYTKIKDIEIASALRYKVKEFVRGKKEEE